MASPASRHAPTLPAGRRPAGGRDRHPASCRPDSRRAVGAGDRRAARPVADDRPPGGRAAGAPRRSSTGVPGRAPTSPPRGSSTRCSGSRASPSRCGRRASSRAGACWRCGWRGQDDPDAGVGAGAAAGRARLDGAPRALRRRRAAAGRGVRTSRPRPVPDLDHHDLAQGSLYDLMRSRYGVDPVRAHETIEPTACEQEDARHLAHSAGRAGDPGHADRVRRRRPAGRVRPRRLPRRPRPFRGRPAAPERRPASARARALGGFEPAARRAARPAAARPGRPRRGAAPRPCRPRPRGRRRPGCSGMLLPLGLGDLLAHRLAARCPPRRAARPHAARPTTAAA